MVVMRGPRALGILFFRLSWARIQWTLMSSMVTLASKLGVLRSQTGRLQMVQGQSLTDILRWSRMIEAKGEG